MVREVELSDNSSIVIEEGVTLENDAGAVIWDAALVLIKFLCLGSICAGQRTIEIGSGTGLVGIAAAALGASSTTLTDLPHLEPLIAANIRANHLRHSTVFAPLRWGDAAETLNPPFDLVLASDVLYQHEHVDPLIQTLVALSGPASTVLLANEHRPKLPFPRSRFAAAGFDVQQVPFEELHPEWRSPDIHVYRLTLVSRY